VPFSEEVSQLLLNKYSIYEIFLYGGNLNARKFFWQATLLGIMIAYK
jgi:hypothetical protein